MSLQSFRCGFPPLKIRFRLPKPQIPGKLIHINFALHEYAVGLYPMIFGQSVTLPNF
jgi:hypothetical protein